MSQSMKPVVLLLSLSALFIVPACAQEFKMPDFEKLSAHAKETVDVTLDQSMLQLASGFLSKDDPDEAQVKKLVSKLKGVYVRSFEFEKEGEYSPSEVEAIRSQLKKPNWSRIVGVKSIKGENTEVYLLKDGDQLGGLVVLDAEPKEFTIVHIDGPINPEDLSRLGGHLGIPDIAKDPKKSKSTKEDEE
jgi:hypothetical protein